MLGYAKELYADFRAKFPDLGAKLGNTISISMESPPPRPIQVADMLSNAWWQYQEYLASPPSEVRRAGVDKILGRQKTDLIKYFSGDVMEKMLDRKAKTPGRTWTIR
ncbi:MAG: hypothetical protein ABIQ65_14950 [Thermoanaerobaculia bacterium]